LASQLRDKPEDCNPGIGVHADGTIHWSYVDWYAIGHVVEDAVKAALHQPGGNLSSSAPFTFTAAVPVARYLYVMKSDSVTPRVPPNLDRPGGMIWRLDQARQAPPFISGLVKYGQVSTWAHQAFPDNSKESPAPLVDGERYYLDAQIDMAFPAQRCVFTYPADKNIRK
jgi:hypothetical protein